MAQVFKLQIAYLDGTVVEVYPGTPMEVDLVQACADAAMRRGIGFLKTEAQARAAIEAGFQEVLMGLKHQTIAVIRRR